jgi:hypothetical protein
MANPKKKSNRRRRKPSEEKDQEEKSAVRKLQDRYGKKVLNFNESNAFPIFRTSIPGEQSLYSIKTTGKF